MSKTTHYELNTPIGSEVLSVMTGLNPNFNTIDNTMYDNEVRSTQALNKANVNEQNIATALGRITTAEGDIDTLESGLETANTNISGLTSRVTTAESGLVSANNRIQENTSQIGQINENLSNKISTEIIHEGVTISEVKRLLCAHIVHGEGTNSIHVNLPNLTDNKIADNRRILALSVFTNNSFIVTGARMSVDTNMLLLSLERTISTTDNLEIRYDIIYH